MPSEVSSPILDGADRPTSLIIVACSRASRDTSDRAFFAPSLRNIIAFITDRFDVEIQRKVLQVHSELLVAYRRLCKSLCRLVCGSIRPLRRAKTHQQTMKLALLSLPTRT